MKNSSADLIVIWTPQQVHFSLWGPKIEMVIFVPRLPSFRLNRKKIRTTNACVLLLSLVRHEGGGWLFCVLLPHYRFVALSTFLHCRHLIQGAGFQSTGPFANILGLLLLPVPMLGVLDRFLPLLPTVGDRNKYAPTGCRRGQTLPERNGNWVVPGSRQTFAPHRSPCGRKERGYQTWSSSSHPTRARNWLRVTDAPL